MGLFRRRAQEKVRSARTADLAAVLKTRLTKHSARHAPTVVLEHPPQLTNS